MKRSFSARVTYGPRAENERCIAALRGALEDAT